MEIYMIDDILAIAFEAATVLPVSVSKEKDANSDKDEETLKEENSVDDTLLQKSDTFKSNKNLSN